MDLKVDYAKLSPSMSRERLVDNLNASLFRLAKKQMAINGDLIKQLLDTPQVNVDTSSNFDVLI